MKILLVTNMYPHNEHNYYGIFVKEQIEAVRKNYKINEKIIFINGVKSVINYMVSIFQINWHLMWNKYDCIHIHYGLSGLFLVMNPVINTPVFLTLHGSDIDRDAKKPVASFISRQVCRRVQKIFVVNERMKEMLPACCHTKVEVLPCGVDTSFFYPDPEQVESAGKITIGFPSDKNRKEKNYPLFKKIVDELAKKYPLTSFVFHNITRTQVRDGLNKIDVLLMTSTNEGSPQIVKEAMACNIPVVSTDVGDVRRLLGGVRNCYVIEGFNVCGFIDPLERIINLEKENRKSDGRAKILKMGLDQKAIAERIMNHYRAYSVNE